jgi:transaldolase
MTETVNPPLLLSFQEQTRGSALQPPDVSQLRVKLFADGADRAGMLEMYAKPYIAGFTTNPTLMRKASISDYRAFARDILDVVTDRPVSFEVFSDEFADMERQALEIASWAENVIVKIPITNTRRESSLPLVRRLSAAGVKLNVTALLTLGQVRQTVEQVAGGVPCYISIFAGRIADTGRDPLPIMAAALELLALAPNAQLIWASPRELLNVLQADAIGCHVITVTNDILKKLALIGKDLEDYSLETVRMFYTDARLAGYTL